MRKIVVMMLLAAFVLVQAGAAMAKDMKIGFVDRRTVFFEYKKIQALTKDLENDNEAARVEAEKKAEDIRKISDEMELLSESAKKEKQAELQTKIKDFDNYRRDKMAELGRKRDDAMKKIGDEVTVVTTTYAKANGYDLILDNGAALYVPESMDVTKDIVKELNK